MLVDMFEQIGQIGTDERQAIVSLLFTETKTLAVIQR